MRSDFSVGKFWRADIRKLDNSDSRILEIQADNIHDCWEDAESQINSDEKVFVVWTYKPEEENAS